MEWACSKPIMIWNHHSWKKERALHPPLLPSSRDFLWTSWSRIPIQASYPESCRPGRAKTCCKQPWQDCRRGSGSWRPPAKLFRKYQSQSLRSRILLFIAVGVLPPLVLEPADRSSYSLLAPASQESRLVGRHGLDMSWYVSKWHSLGSVTKSLQRRGRWKPCTDQKPMSPSQHDEKSWKTHLHKVNIAKVDAVDNQPRNWLISRMMS